MKNNGITAVREYKKHKSYGRGRPQIVPSNHLNREFVVNTPDTLRNDVSQVTDITYIRTWQGWLYLGCGSRFIFKESDRLVNETYAC